MRRGFARFRVVGGAFVGAVCLVAIVVGAAYASSRRVDWRDLHAVAMVSGARVVTDGDPYAAFELSTGPRAVTVFDTRANRIVRTTPLPAGRGLAFGAIGAGVAGGGYVLVVCTPADEQAARIAILRPPVTTETVTMKRVGSSSASTKAHAIHRTRPSARAWL